MKHIWTLRDLFFDQQASLGTCYIYDGKTQLFKEESLERGWVNNENRISCLPECDVLVKLEYSDRFDQMLWEMKGTFPREECKFHAANFWYDLNGCIGLGEERMYIDGDAIMDVSNSRETMKKFHAALYPDTEAMLHIRNVPDLTMLHFN